MQSEGLFMFEKAYIGCGYYLITRCICTCLDLSEQTLKFFVTLTKIVRLVAINCLLKVFVSVFYSF